MIIDVSEHNGVLNWEKLKPQIEGVILRCGYGSDKASQDDKQWARNVSECERLGIPYGVYIYSYAKTEDAARSEAQHVLRLIKGHNPVLPIFWDIEESALQHTARKFFYTFSEAIGSKYRVGLYTGEAYYNACLQGIAANLRWIAKYGTNNGKPQQAPNLLDGKSYHLWQYTSVAIDGHTDASQVINRAALFKTAKKTKKTKKSVATIAAEVIAGKWGVGEDRRARLLAAGYIYSDVQAEVNRRLGGSKKSIDTIAREVIAGQWGNGEDRTNRLEKAGYDPVQIQRRVNELVK